MVDHFLNNAGEKHFQMFNWKNNNIEVFHSALFIFSPTNFCKRPIALLRGTFYYQVSQKKCLCPTKRFLGHWVIVDPFLSIIPIIAITAKLSVPIIECPSKMLLWNKGPFFGTPDTRKSLCVIWLANENSSQNAFKKKTQKYPRNALEKCPIIQPTNHHLGQPHKVVSQRPNELEIRDWSRIVATDEYRCSMFRLSLAELLVI